MTPRQFKLTMLIPEGNARIKDKRNDMITVRATDFQHNLFSLQSLNKVPKCDGEVFSLVPSNTRLLIKNT
jgi:hypothetical protein